MLGTVGLVENWRLRSMPSRCVRAGQESRAHGQEAISKWNRTARDQVPACDICPLIPKFVRLLHRLESALVSLWRVRAENPTPHKPFVPPRDAATLCVKRKMDVKALYKESENRHGHVQARPVTTRQLSCLLGFFQGWEWESWHWVWSEGGGGRQ